MQRPDSFDPSLAVGVKTATSSPQKPLTILTFAPEGNITWTKGISYRKCSLKDKQTKSREAEVSYLSFHLRA